jgi:hypothetical protein
MNVLSMCHVMITERVRIVLDHFHVHVISVTKVTASSAMMLMNAILIQMDVMQMGIVPTTMARLHVTVT